MNSPEPQFPAPRTYKDVPLVPPVDHDDLKRVWNVKPPWTADSHKDACSPGADVFAVVSRRHMIDRLITFKLLAPWTHDEQLDGAVFRLAATFPLHEAQHAPYMIPGDEYFPFDPNAFVQRLVEETGISHVWELVPTKVGDRGRSYVLHSVAAQGAARDPGREARHKARELLHHIWRRFSGFGHLLPRADSEHTSQLPAILFADFLIANKDIVQQVVDGFRQGPGSVGTDLLMEIEQRAMKRI